ncbi:MAG: transcription termination factor Rho [Lachnospiraceae bacterium]|nr:transcription termination factor Rho [Lachnospiraceae bacterium]
MKGKYESLSLATLKDLAKARGLKGTSSMRKARLIEIMLEQDEKEKAAMPGQSDKEKAAVPEQSDKEKAAMPGQDEKEKAAVPEQDDKEKAVMPGKDEIKIAAMEPGTSGSAQDAAPEGREEPKHRPGTSARENQNAGTTRNASREKKGADDDQKNAETGQTGMTRGPQRRRRIPEGNMRPSGERSGGERRSYERPKVRTSQNNAPAFRRNYGEPGGSESRRDYGESGVSETRRVHAEATQVPETHRSNGEPGQSSENRRNYVEPGQSSENRRNYVEPGQASENHRNYVEPVPISENRRGYEGEDASAEPLARNAAGESRSQDIDRPPAELSQLDSGQSVSGILEVMPDGYGFIRSDNYLPGDNDVYVSPSQIRRFNLKTGDIISGNTRIKSQQEKFSALLYLKRINDLPPSEAMRRSNFEDMTPIFPNERLRLERDPRGTAMRIVDLFSPIGKGQRGMIVSPPKAGKTTLLKDIARSLLKNCPKMRILILLIDERPEEVTDIKEAIRGDNVEVIYSTFDETPEHHKRVSEMVIERAKRLVEQKEDVTILLDSITRLARAYNLTVPPSGRTLSGGLDPAALHMPKRFFGAARNMREGGSLTILATALVDTGSKMDDVVYEEFKGTGNMELVLDRKLSERRVFPAIDIPKSGTRREDLLLDREEQEAMYYMRRALNGMKSDDAVESILNLFVHTRDNRDLVTRVRRQKGV